MEPSRDIEQLQRRLDRLEAELKDVRAELTALCAVESAGVVEPPPLPEVMPEVMPEAMLTTDEPAVPVTEEVLAEEPVVAASVSDAAVFVEKAEPPPLPVREVSEPVFTPTGPDWRDWLRSVHLWPPEGGDNAEVRLGAWWATRVGTLLAVIGVVFFGVYVSIDTAPWVKFAELLAVALGVTAGGFWLERRLERFGGVVAAGGLALIYFCSFAAHAVPAVRVVESPVAAGLWQLAAVGVLLGASLWRRSSMIATLAVGLGAATALFALSGGFSGFALFTVGLLAVVSVAFARLRRWEAPSVLALPAVHVVFLAIWANQWRGGALPAGGLPWWFLGVVTVVFFLRDWRGERVSTVVVAHGERWFQGANSSLAALSGVVTALTLYRAELAWFYLGVAVLFGAMAALRRRQVEGDLVEMVLLAKSTGALTLAVIELTAGRTTALALLVQAGVLAWLAPRLRSRVLIWAAGLVAVVAVEFMFKDALAGGTWREAAGPLALFVVGWLWLATLALRRWIADETHVKCMEAAAGVVAGLLAMLSVGGWVPDVWAPAWLAGFALLMTASVWRRNATVFWTAGGLALAVAQVWLWQRAWDGQVELWLNAAAVLSPLAAVSWMLGDRGQWRVVGLGALLVAVFGLAQVFRAELSAEWALAGCLGTGALLAASGPWTGGRRWQAAGTVLAALGVARVWSDSVVLTPEWTAVALGLCWVLPVLWHEIAAYREQAVGADAWVRPAQLGVAAVLSFCLLPEVTTAAVEVLIWGGLGLALSALRVWRGLPGALAVGLVTWALAAWRLEHVAYGSATVWLLGVAAGAWLASVWLRNDEARWGRVGMLVLMTLVNMPVAAVALRGADRVWMMCAAVVAGAVLCRRSGMRGMRGVTMVLAGWGLGQALWLVVIGRANVWSESSLAVMTLSLFTILLPVGIVRANDELPGFGRSLVRWVCGLAGVLVAMLLVWRQPPPWSSYVTVGWGLVAVAVFGAGLLARLRSHRLLGLVILAICVPRVFAVDLSSMLHRIIAFIALGVVLLWVGFSYHRFRHWITGVSADKENDLNHE